MKSPVVMIALLLAVACAPAAEEAEQTAEPRVAEPEVQESPAVVVESYPDPDEEVAQEIQEFVTAWVAERAADDGYYAIPSRAGYEASGKMADFHTVHQKDADTYSVCVDFQSGEQLYDVDFFVDRTADGLAIAEHYLHKINGDAVD